MQFISAAAAGSRASESKEKNQNENVGWLSTAGKRKVKTMGRG